MLRQQGLRSLLFYTVSVNLSSCPQEPECLPKQSTSQLQAEEILGSHTAVSLFPMGPRRKSRLCLFSAGQEQSLTHFLPHNFNSLRHSSLSSGSYSCLMKPIHTLPLPNANGGNPLGMFYTGPASYRLLWRNPPLMDLKMWKKWGLSPCHCHCRDKHKLQLQVYFHYSGFPEYTI